MHQLSTSSGNHHIPRNWLSPFGYSHSSCLRHRGRHLKLSMAKALAKFTINHCILLLEDIIKLTIFALLKSLCCSDGSQAVSLRIIRSRLSSPVSLSNRISTYLLEYMELPPSLIYSSKNASMLFHLGCSPFLIFRLWYAGVPEFPRDHLDQPFSSSAQNDILCFHRPLGRCSPQDLVDFFPPVLLV